METKNYELAAALRHELHAHPELSNQETWTRTHLMDFLRAHTHLEIVDRGTWFYAVYRAAPDARRIAFRADCDALPIDEGIDLPYGSRIPGVSHKCGHDGHSAALAAFALEVDQHGSENTIYFIFQHAEETGDGARVCAPLITEEGIDEIFAFHNAPGLPLGEVSVKEGAAMCASKGMSLFFTGTPAHAAEPEAGRNPAEAIARLICALPGLCRAEDHRGLVMATVIHVDIGEPAFGTSASSGVLRVTLRGQYEEEMDRLQAELEAMAVSLAEEYGLAYRAEFCDCFPETRNHAESLAKVRRVCGELGIPVHEQKFPQRGSEDFGHFTKLAPGAYFDVGSGDIPPCHTFGFDFPDSIIPTAVEVFKALAGVS